jgi:hypothetical protein
MAAIIFSLAPRFDDLKHSPKFSINKMASGERMLAPLNRRMLVSTLRFSQTFQVWP